MAKKSVLIRNQQRKHAVQKRNRCFRCGRGRGYFRDFGVCRICFRELVHLGTIPGVKKASW